MDKTRVFALIAVFLVQVIYGFTFTFANDVIDDGFIKPFGFIFIRVLGAAILFWILSLFTPKQRIEPKDFIILFFASVFGIALNMLTFFKGLEYTTPIHASVTMTVVPSFVCFFLKGKNYRFKNYRDFTRLFRCYSIIGLRQIHSRSRSYFS